MNKNEYFKQSNHTELPKYDNVSTTIDQNTYKEKSLDEYVLELKDKCKEMGLKCDVIIKK